MNIEAYILAGGHSSRMGEEKGLKLLNGIPVIKYSIDILTACFSSVKINTANSEYKKFGLELISDFIPEKGPLGGIYTALKDSGKDIFVVSCDMPCITSQAINFLLKQHKEAPVTIASYNKKIHPLFGIYNHKILPLLEAKITNNQLKVMDLIYEAKADIIEMKEIAEPFVFSNINTPEEFKTIEKKITL